MKSDGNSSEYGVIESKYFRVRSNITIFRIVDYILCFAGSIHGQTDHYSELFA